jgi:hypothetical protein
LGEGAEEFGEELSVEGPDLLRHGAEVAGEVAAPPEVDDGGRERLYERRARVGEAGEVRTVAQSVVERAPQRQPYVLDGVVVVHPGVALSLHPQVQA